MTREKLNQTISYINSDLEVGLIDRIKACHLLIEAVINTDGVWLHNRDIIDNLLGLAEASSRTIQICRRLLDDNTDELQSTLACLKGAIQRREACEKCAYDLIMSYLN